jgi:hypothetical protein
MIGIGNFVIAINIILDINTTLLDERSDMMIGFADANAEMTRELTL